MKRTRQEEPKAGFVKTIFVSVSGAQVKGGREVPSLVFD